MRPLTALLAALLTALCAWPAASVEIIPLDEIRPGMKGLAYTVFRGDSVSSFEIEVIGRMPGRGTFDLVLVRAEPELLARGGVSQGMSGSPVYIDGRLLGALAYNFSYAREPLAMITPIGAMLELAERGGDDRSDSGGPDRLPFLLGDAMPTGAGFPIETLGRTEAATDPLTIGISGLAPGALDALGGAFAGSGLSFVAIGAASAGRAAGNETGIEPGSAVAVELLRGPVGAAAIGTLTHVDGKKLWAFGHPFLDEGAVDLPLSSARVLGTMSSIVNSFKIAIVGEPIGRILRDGRAGIYGEFGDGPALVPMSVRLHRAGTSVSADFEIAHHTRLMGNMARIGIQGWLDGPLAMQDEGGVGVSLTIYPTGAKPVSVSQRFAGENVIEPIGLWVKSFVDALQRNPSGPVPIESLAVEIDWEDGAKPIGLSGLTVDRQAVGRGESWRLRARFLEGGREFGRDFDVPAADLPSGEYQIHFADASSYQIWDAARQPAIYRFEDHESLLSLIDRLEPGGQWILWLSRSGERSVLGGREVDLPIWYRQLQPTAPKVKREESGSRLIAGTPLRFGERSETRGYASIPVSILTTPTRSAP